jgi:tRNA G10  N-methylase Trm11
MLISVSRIKKLEPSIKRYLKGKKSFRIICSKENEMIPIEKKYLYSIENKIVKQYNLYLNIYKPEHEFWFLQRREGIGFFMLRLTKNKNKNIFKGQLRSELAYILCYLSEPNKEDIFLDPFAGYNSIPQERNKFQYYKNIIANEKDRKKIKFLEKIFRNQNINGKIMQEDALNMNSISAGSISKIVTDPPWGLYQQLNTSITKFYDSMINEFYRILKNNGICVVLTARKEEFEKVLEKYKTRFEIIKKYDILVSGKKTAVYKLLKN